MIGKGEFEDTMALFLLVFGFVMVGWGNAGIGVLATITALLFAYHEDKSDE